MTKRQLHEDCKTLSQAVYGNNLGKTINGWECIDAQSYENGYYVEAYKKGNQIIMVSRGTEPGSLKDWYNDYKLAGSNMPSQVDSAKEFYSKIKEKYGKDNDIILTGHSLGGSISQLLGSEKGNETVTFSAYGTNQIPNSDKKYSDNITNYGSKYDGVFMNNIDNQIGKTLILTDKKDDSQYAMDKGTIPTVNTNGKYMHFLKNLDNLSDNVEYQKPDSTIWGKEKGTPLFKIGIEENVDLSKNNNLSNDYKTNNVLKYSGLDKAQQPLSIEKNEIKEPQNGIFGQTFPNISNPQQNGANGVNGVNINNFGDNDKLFPTGKSLHTGSSLTNNNPINTPSTTFDDLSKKYGIKNTPVSSPIFSHIPMSDLSSEFSQIPTTKQNIRDIIRNQSEKNDGVDISDYNTLSRNNSFGADNDNSITNSNKKFQDLDLEELLKRLWRLV